MAPCRPWSSRRGAASVPDERVVVTRQRPETITIHATAVADGLLVVSEPYAWGWNASVDGNEVAVLRTNHALRGVPLAAGDHTVVLSYEPRSLAVGLRVTGAADPGAGRRLGPGPSSTGSAALDGRFVGRADSRNRRAVLLL